MIKVTGFDKFFSDIAAWEKAVAEEYMRIAINLMYIMLGQALRRSPQYSGDFVANFQLSVNKINTDFRQGIFPEKKFPTDNPFQRQDRQAIGYATQANVGRLGAAKLGDTLWLANTAVHDDLYAWKIEDGLMRFRPQNFGSEGPLRKTKSYMLVHFKTINKTTVEFLK